MSGIAGIIHFDGAPVTPGLVEKMTSAMAHRGPDGIRHWVRGSVALGQCMLCSTSESLDECQPLANDDESLVLVMDGRVDNRNEIIDALRKRGLAPRNASDAELVLGAYRLWGKDSPRHLLGDFAFAVWDARAASLFCARDHVGARQLHYVSNRQFFAFASEDEALLGLPGVSGLPNEDLIANLFVPAFQNFDHQRSWLRDVSTLMPANTIEASACGKIRSDTYWQLKPGDEDMYTSDQECEEAFLAVFQEAIRCRMRVAGHVGAMMSGGMDSASIGAMVRRTLPEMPAKEFHTYSAIADNPEACAESRCIKTLTESCATRAHFVSVPSFDGMVSVGDLIDTAWSKAHPCDNSIVLPAMMCLAAARQGDRVLLHGVSGDLTMHVPNRYPAHLMRGGQWRRAWEECRGASRNNTYVRGTSPFSLFLLNAWSAKVPGETRRLARSLFTKRAPLAQSAINPDFVARIRLQDRLSLPEPAEKRPHDADIRQAHAQMLCSTKGVMLGLAGYDRVAARHGVELRDPWADRRVLEFFVRLPLKYKVRDGWTKFIARKAFAPDLDAHVLWRSDKEHLGWNFVARLMEESHPFVSTTLEQNRRLLEEYVDLRAIRPRNDHGRLKGGADPELMYDATVLALWLRRVSTTA